MAINSTAPPSALPPDTPMLVHPVYLAGRGESEPIYDALCDTRGWGKAITATGLMFTSGCQSVHVAYLPEHLHGGWKITQYREPLGMPAWSARFTENTPAEITAAFTTALADHLGSEHRDYAPGGPKYLATGPSKVLAGRGWTHTSNALYQYLHAPDGHAYFSTREYDLDEDEELAGEGPAQWTMYGCVDKAGGERWHATFTSGTPLSLVTRTALALSNPEPVERRLGAIPVRNLPYVTARPANVPAARTTRTQPVTSPALPSPAPGHPPASTPSHHR
ncbi:MAG: DUF317 domain-containing protein [Streptomycetaceae bacterium]|nr:DUF317 domain-containing protein [Streptomycetaceae bacterium]